MKTILIVEEDEIIEHRELSEDEDISIQKKKKTLTAQQQKILNQKNELKKYCNERGGFIQMLCIRNNLLFNELEIEKQNISRIIYLATFIDYNTNQENLLIKHGQNYKIEPMNKIDIQNKLKLKGDPFRAFMQDVKKNELLFEVDGKFYLSNKYFTKGKSNFRTKEYTRIFIKPVQYLYEHTTPRQHGALSYVYQLIPYMNYETNIICSNPLETDFCKLNKMSLKEVCSMLGLKADRKAVYRLKETLSKFYIKVDNQKYYVFAYAVINGSVDYYVVNPLVIWGGSNTDNLKEVIKLCFFK